MTTDTIVSALCELLDVAPDDLVDVIADMNRSIHTAVGLHSWHIYRLTEKICDECQHPWPCPTYKAVGP